MISTARPPPASSSSSVRDPSRRIMTTGPPMARKSRSRRDSLTRSSWPAPVGSRPTPTTSGASRGVWIIYLWSHMCYRWSRSFLCPVTRKSPPLWPCRASHTRLITSRRCVTSSGEQVTNICFKCVHAHQSSNAKCICLLGPYYN